MLIMGQWIDQYILVMFRIQQQQTPLMEERTLDTCSPSMNMQRRFRVQVTVCGEIC